MRTLLIPPAGTPSEGDSYWHPLIEGLESGGVTVVAHGESSSLSDAVVLISRDFRILLEEPVRKLPAQRRVLIVLEPPTTAPLMYTKATRRSFGHIFSASPRWSELLKGTTFVWP